MNEWINMFVLSPLLQAGTWSILTIRPIVLICAVFWLLCFYSKWDCVVFDVTEQRMLQRIQRIFQSLNFWKELTAIWVSIMGCTQHVSSSPYIKRQVNRYLNVCMMCCSPLRRWSHTDRRRHRHRQWGWEKCWPLHQPWLHVGKGNWWEGLHSLLHYQPLLWVSDEAWICSVYDSFSLTCRNSFFVWGWLIRHLI